MKDFAIKGTWIKIFFITLLFSSFLFVLILMQIGLWERFFTTNVNSEGFLEVVKYYKLSKSTGESSIGYTGVQKEDLDGLDYFTQSTEDDHFLFSKFGTTEYKCTGTCVCESGQRRSIASSLLSKHFYVLVAALTSTVALQMASNDFDDECKEKLSESCTDSSIQSEVEECSPVKVTLDEGDENIEEDRGKASNEYTCTGRCLPVDIASEQEAIENSEVSFPRKYRKLFEKRIKKFKCRRLFLNQDVIIGDVVESSENNRFFSSDLMVDKNHKPTEEESAMMTFLEDLDLFCQKNSLTDMKELSEALGAEEQDLYLCQGVETYVSKKLLKRGSVPLALNPSVKCLKNN